MNILMVSNEFPPSIGGVQTHVLELSRTLVKLNHQVHVVTRRRDQDTPAKELIDGVIVERRHLPDSHLLYDWLLHRHILRKIKENQIDIVHVHGMRPLKACRKLPVPVIFTNHTSSFTRRAESGEKARRKMLKQLNSASAVIAVSELLAEKTKQTGYRGPIHFIGNGIDPQVFSPGTSPLRNRLSIPNDAFVIAVAGRLEAVKGIRFLAEAVAAINDPQLHLVIAGDGKEKEEIENILREKIRSGHAHLLGEIPYRDILDIYRGADVLALPSFMEGMSIAGLEAMACGLPLIASNVGGMPYLVKDGETGILTEPGSVESLEQAILQLLNDRDLTRTMGLAALKRVKQNFTWEKIASEVIANYLQLLTPQ